MRIRHLVKVPVLALRQLLPVSRGSFPAGILGLLGLLITASAASAVTDLPLFGPERFDRLKGAPTVYVDTFERCEPSDLALLRVWNGDGKATRITSAEIFVNGAEIFSENEFKQKVDYLEKLIPVREVNELKVVLKSGDYKVPAFLLIDILGKNCDDTPPVISGLEPADGALLGTATPRIGAFYADEEKGSGLDLASIRLTVDGRDVTAQARITDSAVTYDSTDSLSEGAHTVTLFVSDRAFNGAQRSWSFTTDTIAPKTQISSHQDQQWLNTAAVTLSGSVDDPTAVVTVNGAAAHVVGGSFSLANLSLTEGANEIVVIATDPAGNSNTEQIVLNLDTVPPAVTVSAPQPDIFVNTPQIPVAGSVDEPVLSVTVNGAGAELSGSSFALASLSLQEGTNTLVVRAVDRAGNEGTIAVPLTLDTVPPSVTLSAPLPGFLTNNPRAAVAGAVDEPVLKVTVNGAAAALAGQEFALDYLLAEGGNILAVTAVDRAGNPGTASVGGTLDTIAPAAPVLESLATPTNVPRTAVSGQAEAGSTVKIYARLPGADAPQVIGAAGADASGAFSLPGVDLQEGATVFTAAAVDAAGNQSELSSAVSVVLDTVPPVVTVAAPIDGLFTSRRSVDVSGSVDEPVASLAVNGTAATVTGQDFVLAGVPLFEGENPLVVAAVDLAGNSAATAVTVTLDTVPPTVVIDAPADGLLTNIAQVDVAGSVGEPVTAVTVNGASAQLEGQSYRLAAVGLSEGANALTVQAVDRAGNVGAAGVGVTLDSIAPAAPLLDPPASPTNKASVDLSGTAEAGATVDIFVQTPQAPEAPVLLGTLTADGTGHFSRPGVALTEGETVFTAAATDAAGNESAVSEPVSVVLDTVAPVITITSPADQSYSPGLEVHIVGTVDDPAATLTVDGAPAVLTAGAFDHVVTLQPGANGIILLATDLAGNSGSAGLTVNVDSTPPEVTIVSPPDGWLTNDPGITVRGTLSEAGASATLNGTPIPVDGQDFTVAATLQEGENTLAVAARDAAGNSGSTSIRVVLDSQAPAVTLSSPAEAGAGETVQLSLSAADGRALSLVEVAADGRAFWSRSFSGGQSLNQTLPFTFAPDLAAGSRVTFEARAYDEAGNMAGAPAGVDIVRGASGPGYLQGEVYDDSTGLRLEGVEVTVIGEGTTRSATTLADGGYFFELPGGDYRVVLARPGCTTVYRDIAVPAEQTVVALDARLTPVSAQANPVGFAGGVVQIPLDKGTGAAGWLAGPNPALELAVPESALAEDVDLRLTPVGNQGLAAPVPCGWSPAAVFDLRFLTSAGEPFPGEMALYFPATVKVPLLASYGLAAGSEIVVAGYDEVLRRWTVEKPAVVSPDGAFAQGALSRAGQFALLLADTGDGAPPAAVSGQPLLGTSPVDPPAEALVGAGEVVPPVAPPAEDLQAVGEVVLTVDAAVDPAGTLSSGVVLNGRVTEKFDLFSGEVVQGADYVQDLVLYRQPCLTSMAAGVAAAALDGGALRTTFPVTPSRRYTIVELMMGKVGIEVTTAPEQTASGVLAGPDGALIMDGDGNSLAIPAGALSETVPVELHAVPDSLALPAVGDDFALLRALDLNLTRRTLAISAELSIPVPGGFDPALPVVVARAIEAGGARKLKLVALGRVSGSLIASTTSHASGIAPQGIISSGTYFFLQAKAPLGFVQGQVQGAAGGPFAGALVTTDTCSLSDLSAADGRYLVAATVGAFSANALDLAKFDEGSAEGSLAAAGQAVTADLVVRAAAPRINAVFPADGATGVEPGASIAVAFSEPVARDSVTAQSIVLTDASGQVLPGVFSFSPDETTVTFYPAEALKSETRHAFTIAAAIRDRQGYTLGQDHLITFTVRDTTPPPRPPAGAISATFPDEEGYVTVTATQGSAEADCTVLLINDTSGEIVAVVPGSDGSFTGRILAQLGDEIQVVLMDAAGNQTLISYLTFKSPDGRYLVTAKGGKVEGEGGLLLEIPEGALLGPAVVKITQVSEAALPHPVPAEGKFLAGVNIDTGGVRFQKEVKLSVPVPADLPAEAFPFVAQPATQVNPDGREEQVYEIVDTSKIVDDRLTTASPPFDGIFGYGIFTFLFLPQPAVAIISGTTYREMDDVGGFTSGDLPVAGAVIRSPQAWNFVSYSRSNGFYAVFAEVFDRVGVSGSIEVTAIHPQTMFRTTVRLPTQAPLLVHGLNFKLADKETMLPDTAPPNINLQIHPVAGQSVQMVGGTVPVGTEFEVPVSILDEGMESALLTVEFQGTDAVSPQTYPVRLDATGKPALHAPATEFRQAVWKFDYQPVFEAPLAGASGSVLHLGEPGVYRLIVDGVDLAGNRNRRSLQIRAVAPDELPGSKEGPPFVDQITPGDGAMDITINTEVLAIFSEPVQNLTAETFRLYDRTTGQAVPALVYTTIDGGRMRGILQPRQNLSYGHDYEVVLSQAITDIQPNLLFGETVLPLDREYRTTFTTKVPRGFSVEPSFDQGWGIALFTHPSSGRTYAYVTAREKGWSVIDVTDPSHPVTVREFNQIAGGVTRTFRGVAVDPQSGILAITEDIRFLSGNQYGYVRFYDLIADPTTPHQIGQEKVAEAMSGIPGRVTLYNNHALIATAMAGIQVVDLQVAQDQYQNGRSSDGSSIVGVLDTGGLGYGQPNDIRVYKTGSAVITTNAGYLVTVDLSTVAMPRVLKDFRPGDNRFTRVDVAGEYVYTDETGIPQAIDLVVAGGYLGRLQTIDLTDPYNPRILSAAVDDQGQPLFCPAQNIVISKAAAQAYVTSLSSIRIFDIRDPFHPREVAAITGLDGASGGGAPLGQVPDLVEKDGWLYTSNMVTGMNTVELGSDAPPRCWLNPNGPCYGLKFSSQ